MTPERGEADTILGLPADVGGLLEIDEFRSGILDALDRVLPSDWMSLSDLGPQPGRSRSSCAHR